MHNRFDAAEMINVVEQYAIEIEENGPAMFQDEAEYLLDMIARRTMSKTPDEFSREQWRKICGAYCALTDRAIDSLRHIVEAEEGGARDERRAARLGH